MTFASCPKCDKPWHRPEYEDAEEEMLMIGGHLPTRIKRPGRVVVTCHEGHRFVTSEAVKRPNKPVEYGGLEAL